MITYSDSDYQSTKLIKQGKATLPDQFAELAVWIDQMYKVKVLNIVYDLIDPGKRPRLNIIFEFPGEAKEFNIPGNSWEYDKEKQKAIADRFKRSADGERKKSSIREFVNNIFTPKYDLFVIFSAFKPIAREEANHKILEKELQELKDEIGNEDLWIISHQFASATFFFYTDEQVRKYADTGIKEIFSDKYFNMLKRYDEFDYYERQEFSVSLDSKENFDKKYDGNWYNYYH